MALRRQIGGSCQGLGGHLVLNLSLGREHAIERASMGAREVPRPLAVENRDVQRRERLGGDDPGKVKRRQSSVVWCIRIRREILRQ